MGRGDKMLKIDATKVMSLCQKLIRYDRCNVVIESHAFARGKWVGISGDGRDILTEHV